MDRASLFSGTKDVDLKLLLDHDSLEKYLRNLLGNDTNLLDIKQFKGGQSNPTYLVQTNLKSFVLRRKPPGKLLASAHAVDREYKVISALNKTDVPVPKTYGFCEDVNVAGTPFFLMDHVEGNIFWDLLLTKCSAKERSKIYWSMNDTIAKLHNTDFKSIGLGDYGKYENYMARQIARWSKQYKDSETTLIPEMDSLIQWLPENIPSGEETSIVHGDFRLDNMVFDKNTNEVIAILDWELSTLGHPIADFTYHMMMWKMPLAVQGIGILGANLKELNIPNEDEYAEAYYRKTNRNEIQNWNFFLAYNMFRLAGITQGIAGRVRDGTASSDQAKQYGAFVPVLAKMAWLTVQAIK